MREEVKRTWNEPLRMIIIGIASIAAVIGGRMLFEKFSAARPGDSRALAQLSERVADVADSNEELMRRLASIETELVALGKRTRQLEARPTTSLPLQPRDLPGDATPDSPPLPSAASVPQVLSRGFAYIAKGQFDTTTHSEVLDGLVRAYAIRGLSTEQNTAIVSAIQQVNEIGVTHVLREVATLPTSDAIRHLRAFIKSTPRLTSGQIRRLNAQLSALGT